MPFANSVLGGTILTRTAEQSQNYNAGVSGWRIARDGTVEFNGGTFRGSIEVGPLAGAHFIVNNVATGDVIDVYDSSGNLIFKITALGILASISPSSGSEITIGGATMTLFLGSSVAGAISESSVGTPSSTRQTILGLSSASLGSGAQGALNIISGSDDNTIGAYATINAQGGQYQPVVSDSGNVPADGSIINVQRYSAVVAGGKVTFTHNAAFTPAGAVLGPHGNFSQYNWDDTFGTNGFSSTQARFVPYFPNGTTPGNGLTVTFDGWLWK